MKSEKLQDAIGMVKDEFVDEAHGESEIQSIEAESESRVSNSNSWIAQGAKGLGLGIPKSRDNKNGNVNSASKEDGEYNSWIKLAQNTERQEKMKKNKGFNSRHLQKITVAAACLILALSIGIPWANTHLNLGLNGATEDATSSEPTTDASDDPKDTVEAEYETEADVEGSAAEAAGESSDAVSDTYYDEEPIATFPAQGEAFVLTAGEWNDNSNWPFFTNLVTSGVIDFPSYGVDPRYRIKVAVTDDAGNALANEQVTLWDEYDKSLWTAKTNKDGIAYLFYEEGSVPAYVICNGVEESLNAAATSGEDFQGTVEVTLVDDLELVVPRNATDIVGTQVMFIVDTTGSMGDELAYLQMDFADIAEETADSSVWFSANFYRDDGDEYVTKTNEFTQNLATVQKQLSDEYAAGGGDLPEAVAEILTETITNNDEWRDDCNKVAFLIFDAPPHYGTDLAVKEAATSAAERGIHLVPVVASNADRDTELFGRALAITTDGTYVFLTDHSGVGESHLEPIVGDYTVELLHDVIVRIINSYK